MSRLNGMLKRHEGWELKLYRCTVGKLTIGCGWNIEDNGIPDHIAQALLEYSIQERVVAFVKYKWFTELSEVRKDIIIDMSFMGVGKLLGFKKMIAALQAGDYQKAAQEMLSSKWASQVGNRSKELAVMMIENRYLTNAELAVIWQ